MINLNIKNVIFILVIIGVFIGIIYFIVNNFKTTCSGEYKFDKILNKCIPKCPSVQINDPGTGECVCPNKDDHYDSSSGTCIRKCNSPFTLFCNDQCLDPNKFACIKDKICSKDPDYTCGGIDCCDPNVSGNNLKCSNGKIIFLQNDSFILKENNYQYTITIKQNFDGYNFNISDPDYYCKIIQDLLNNASISNKYNYVVSTKDPILTDDKKTLLSITVSNNNNFQPTLDFTNSKYPELFGFDNSSYQFSNNQIISSNAIPLYKCNVLPCKYDEYPCGKDCCDEPYSCIGNTCCTKSRNKIICQDGTGKNICCPIINGISTCCPGTPEGCCPEGTMCHLNTKTNKYECMVQCINDPSVWCDQIPSEPSQRTGQYCVDFTDWKGNKKSYCGHQDCVFDSITYTPPKIGNYDVCMDNQTDPDNPRYYTYYKKEIDLKRTSSSPYDLDHSKEKSCGPEDCEKRLNEYGTVDVVPNLTDATCDSTYRCDDVLNNQNTLDKLNNKCPPNAAPYQCCDASDGTYTGQICYDKNVALLNSDGKTCECEPIGTQNSKYCSGNGTTKLSIDGKSIECECNAYTAGNICQYNSDNYCNSVGFPYSNSDGSVHCKMPDPIANSCVQQWYNGKYGPTPGTSNPDSCDVGGSECVCSFNASKCCPSNIPIASEYSKGGSINTGSTYANWKCGYVNPHP